MKYFPLIILILYPFTQCLADVSLEVYVQNYKRHFGVKVIGKKTTRLAISVPECLGNLAFDVRDGYKYRIDTDKNCVMRVTYQKAETTGN